MLQYHRYRYMGFSLLLALFLFLIWFFLIKPPPGARLNGTWVWVKPDGTFTIDETNDPIRGYITIDVEKGVWIRHTPDGQSVTPIKVLAEEGDEVTIQMEGEVEGDIVHVTFSTRDHIELVFPGSNIGAMARIRMPK